MIPITARAFLLASFLVLVALVILEEIPDSEVPRGTAARVSWVMLIWWVGYLARVITSSCGQ